MNWLEEIIHRYFQYLDAKGATFNAVIGFLCVTAVGAFDVLAPDEATHSFLYLIPIVFVTWFCGIRLGIVIALMSTAIWSNNNIVDNGIITTWNISTTALFFTMMSVLVNKTRSMWEHEKNLSSTDPLTGAKNYRAFKELAEYELLRLQREELPCTLAYLDLDNFKLVNDTFGHHAGDALLKSIVENTVRNLRKTDLLGRLGGDEFAILFPATDQAAAKIVLQKICSRLNEYTAAKSVSTTFSIGVVTVTSGIHTIDALISYADARMYEVKHTGKNNIVYSDYPQADT